MANNIVVVDTGKIFLGKMNNGLAAISNLDGNVTAGLYASIAGGLSASTVLANITPPLFTGYAAQTIATPVAGSIDGRDQFPITYAIIDFQPTGSGGLPVTALGYYVFHNGTSTLLWVQPFASTFSFTSTSTVCTFAPVFEYGQLPIP